MPMRSITAKAGLQLARDSAFVLVLMRSWDGGKGADEQAAATARSIIENTDARTPLLFAGSAACVARVDEELSAQAHARTLSWVFDSGAVESHVVNEAARACHPCDLVLVTAGIRVTAKWLERLRNAARSDSTVASATPLSLGAGAMEVVDLDPIAAGGIEELACRVAERSACLRPRIATIGPACAYIRRPAWELVGPLNEALDLERALAELAARAIAAGMLHVGADDVLVGGTHSAGDAGEQHEAPSGPRLEQQVEETIVHDERGRAQRALGVGRMAVRPLSVTIDGRALTSSVGGTQTYIIELILALGRERGVTVRVLMPPDPSARAAAALASLSGVEFLTYEQALSGPPMTDVVHRPQPVFTPDDLALLGLLGERMVIGQHDLISYHNYSYHRDIESWRSYRRTTRLALAAADQVIFFSEHARRDALAEDLLPKARTHVIGVGAEALESAGAPASPPEGILQDQPFLLCLGADYSHKNRPFAIELLGALLELGWEGRLVLAGAHVAFGSSRERESALLRSRSDLDQLTVDLGPVDEPAKRWLYRHARALVYPTLYEGLGLLPLEAARADLPCLFASQASLAEVSGRAATLVPWDADASAAAVLPLLSEGQARERHLAELHSLPIPNWAEVGQRLVSVYERAVMAPPSEAGPRSWQELDRENYIVTLDQGIEDLKTLAQEYQDAYHALEARVSAGLALIDEGGLLSRAQQRGLMRIAARRRIGRLLLFPLGLLGRR